MAERSTPTTDSTIALDEREGVSWPADSGGDTIRPQQDCANLNVKSRCVRDAIRVVARFTRTTCTAKVWTTTGRVALLDEDLYFPDGQIKGEVYEYGSFIQSRMFHAGVTCSDCHEPHSLKLRADGNNVCLQCHFAPKYDSPKHHFHQIGSPGARCVECHMPTRTYMVIDARRDHSLRIPARPVRQILGTPNACTNCHKDKSTRWASDSTD